MPRPRPTPGLARPSTIAATATAVLAVLALLSPPASAAPDPGPPAAPSTSSEAMTQLTHFNEQFEKITERYNDARIALRKRQGEARAADQRARTAQARYANHRQQVARIVSSSYRTAPFSQFAAMLSSGSPQEFTAQAAAIEVVSHRRGAALAAAGEARATALAARHRARTALAAAERLTRELAAQKADLTGRAARSRAMFERLSAAERRAFLESDGHAASTTAERASRSTTRPPANVAASGRAKIAVDTALKQLGKPYVWAAAGPGSYDCSGLTMYAWAAAGVSLPHSSRMQIDVGQRVSRDQLRPGDLVFFYSPISHVGMYIGNGQMVHAPTFNDVVKISSIDSSPWAGASRPG